MDPLPLVVVIEPSLLVLLVLLVAGVLVWDPSVLVVEVEPSPLVVVMPPSLLVLVVEFWAGVVVEEPFG